MNSPIESSPVYRPQSQNSSQQSSLLENMTNSFSCLLPEENKYEIMTSPILDSQAIQQHIERTRNIKELKNQLDDLEIQVKQLEQRKREKNAKKRGRDKAIKETQQIFKSMTIREVPQISKDIIIEKEKEILESRESALKIVQSWLDTRILEHQQQLEKSRKKLSKTQTQGLQLQNKLDELREGIMERQKQRGKKLVEDQIKTEQDYIMKLQRQIEKLKKRS